MKQAIFPGLLFLFSLAGCANLIDKSMEGDASAVRSLLEGGADVHARDEKGRTALYYAAESGHLDVVQALLDHGADVNVKDPDGRTPLILAARGAHTGVAQELMDRGADIHARCYGRSALLWAIESSDIDIVMALLEHGADVNESNENGTTALMSAAEEGHTDVVKVLLDRGASRYARDQDGRTALSYAIHYKRRVKIILVRERLRYFASIAFIEIYDPKTRERVGTERTNQPRDIIVKAINNGMVIKTDSPSLRNILSYADEIAEKRSAELISILSP